jgi:hypothetical protein
LLLATGAPPARGADPTSDSPGTVRFFKVANSRFDAYTQAPTRTQQEWMRAHYWRMLA